jgi:hypothetical protein
MAPAVLAALAVCCSGCSSSHGTALSGEFLAGGTFGVSPLRPGLQLGLLDVLLHNASHTPITLNSITVPGKGVGTVIRVVNIKIAPFTPRGVPGGAFNTYPPVERNSGKCDEDLLRTVHGFRMKPGANANVYVVIQAREPGLYNVTHHVVNYTQNGTTYNESITTGYTGSVARNARYIPADPTQTTCLKSTGARLLPWFHAKGSS